MSIPRDAIPLDDFLRMEKGLPPKPKEKIVRPEPEPPRIENLLEFSKLEADKIKRIFAISQPERLRNKDGVIFIYYRIQLEMLDGSLLAGKMLEGDAIRVRRLPWVREATDARILGMVR